MNSIRMTQETKQMDSDGPVTLPHELEEIIIDYLADDANDERKMKYLFQRKLTLFGNISNLLIFQAAKYILLGDLDCVEELVKNNRSILYSVVKAVDYLGRQVEGTLLQIAAMSGDLNVSDRAGKVKNCGIVEMLCRYLPKEEAVKQLNATFPPGWEIEMKKRMQPYLTAYAQLMEDIIAAEATTSPMLEIECKPAIEKFKKTLIPSTDVITTGFIFDPQVFCIAINLFNKNYQRFGEWGCDKGNLLMRYGYGSLQALASACEFKIFKKGILTSSIRVDKILSGLGTDFYLNVYGYPAKGVGKLVLGDEQMNAFILEKNKSLENLMSSKAMNNSNMRLK